MRFILLSEDVVFLRWKLWPMDILYLICFYKNIFYLFTHEKASTEQWWTINGSVLADQWKVQRLRHAVSDYCQRWRQADRLLSNPEMEASWQITVKPRDGGKLTDYCQTQRWRQADRLLKAQRWRQADRLLSNPEMEASWQITESPEVEASWQITNKPRNGGKLIDYWQAQKLDDYTHPRSEKYAAT
jgi:hypothetical protein